MGFFFYYEEQSDDRCGIPTELVLSASADTADLMREVAEDFVKSDRDHHGCRREHIQVVSPSVAGGTTKALEDGWPSEDLRSVGPYPHVWIPSSSVDVNRVKAAIGKGNTDIPLTTLPSVMSSYLVLAAPSGLAGQPGWDDPSAVSLAAVVKQAENGALRIVREGPETSTEGLVSTMALYQAAVGAPLTRSGLSGGGIGATLHRLEQATITSDGIGDPERGLGCQAATSTAPDFKVALMSEQAVFAHNKTPSCGVPSDQLTAFYPTDGVPLLDYPFVMVGGRRWGNPKREAVARRLHDFLELPETQSSIAAAGFRPAGGAPIDLSASDTGIQSEVPQAKDQPGPAETTDAADELEKAWRSARRQARVLFTIDVSGSMAVSGLDGVTPLDAARQAIGPALGLVRGDDQIGLWEFATRLDGDRDYVEKVGLGTADTGSGSRLDDIRQALPTLHRENGDTGLFDTIGAGVAALRAQGGATTADAMVVFTDAINDKPGGTSPDRLAGQLNLPGAPPVRVFLLAFGEANCSRPDLQPLLAGGATCENVSSTDVGKAVERVGSGLWGIH
ncbi:substrate-binding and VWA domain-containing protein [Frankia gtarii]|nr:substrate-binding and VWA domain-containing protein [Frankia gtarii]